MIKHIEDPLEYTCPECDAEPAKSCRETPEFYHSDRKDIAAHLSGLKDEVEIRLDLKLDSDKFIKELIWMACLDDVDGYRDMSYKDFAECLQEGIEPKKVEDFISYMYGDPTEVPEQVEMVVDHFRRLK